MQPVRITKDEYCRLLARDLDIPLCKVRDLLASMDKINVELVLEGFEFPVCGIGYTAYKLIKGKKAGDKVGGFAIIQEDIEDSNGVYVKIRQSLKANLKEKTAGNVFEV